MCLCASVANKLIQNFDDTRVDVFKPENPLTLMILFKSFGIGFAHKRNQLPSHGSVDIAADDEKSLPGIDDFHIVIFRDIDGCDVIYGLFRIVFFEVLKFFSALSACSAVNYYMFFCEFSDQIFIAQTKSCFNTYSNLF